MLSYSGWKLSVKSERAKNAKVRLPTLGFQDWGLVRSGTFQARKSASWNKRACCDAERSRTLPLLRSPLVNRLCVSTYQWRPACRRVKIERHRGHTEG